MQPVACAIRQAAYRRWIHRGGLLSYSEGFGVPMTQPDLFKIDLNTHVELEMICSSGEREFASFDIVAEEDADYYAGFLGICTPLAQAILGHKAGDRIKYKAGDLCEVIVVSVSAMTRQVPADSATHREQVMRKIVAESELKNRIAVATSVDNKWGDYDPESLLKNLDEESEDNPGVN